MRLVRIALIVVAATAHAQQNGTPMPSQGWAQEPTSFRRIPFGAPMAEAKKILGWGGCGKDWCRYPFKLGDIEVSALYNFTDGTFVRVNGGFPSANYDFMRDVFILKYGPPHHADKQAVQNKLGATLDNETLVWTGATIQCVLSRYGNTLDEGYFMMALKSELVRMEAEERAKRAKAAEEL